MTETRRFPPAADAGAAADLARLAFASAAGTPRDTSLTPRHLAFLPPDALDLDLSDPAQRDFGPYELLEKIGQGGMGVVYRARQKSLDREVALKLLAAGPWASPDFVEQFRREAKAAARMEHPNIVAIYETGDSDELNYFSMRLVRGRSLAARLREEGPYSPVAAARLMRTVAEAVDYAHSLGILHLDLKPGNVLLDENGTPLVADFGLARRLDHALADTPYEIAGTPSYMSPEQVEARGGDIGVATDIYGLGAILYEVLSGRPPFLGDTPQQTLQRVLATDAAPLDKIPADLEAICRCCLAKRPADRYGRARQLADDLQRFLEGREVSVRPQSPWERARRWARREPRTALAAAAVLTTLVIGIAATASQWRRAERAAEASRELLWEGRIESALQSARDGDGYHALPQLLANANERQAAGARAAAARERRRMGELVGQGARLVDETAITDANPLAAEISPDGSLLALALNDLTIRWYDAKTLTERGRVNLADREPSDGQPRPVLLLRFIDSRRLLATMEWYSNFASPGGGDSWLVDTEHARVVTPPAAFADFGDACFSADGRHALLRDHQHRAQWWQVEPWRPLSPLGAQMPGFMPCLLAPDGRFAAFLGVGSRDLFVYALPALAAPTTLTTPDDAGVSAWMLSHDGRTLALGDFEGRVFTFDTRTWAVHRLATTRGREITWLAFSEDDRWLAVSGFDGVVRVLDADSGEPVASGQMEHDFPVQRLGLSHAQHLLVAAGEGRVALWRLPRSGPRAVRAERIGLAPAPHALAARYPVGWSLEQGLLATAGIDGQLRLWRLPREPMRAADAARQIPETLAFDGRRVVDVDGRWLRLVDPQDRALTPWVALAQPPGFAEVLPGGQRMGLTLGASLVWRDATDLHPLGIATALPATPMHWLASADGRRLLLGFGGSDGRAFVETLQLFDTTSGRRLPGEAVLPGPVRHLAISDDGQWLLAVGPADASIVVLRSDNLQRRAEFANDPDAPVVWADFDPLDRVWLATRAGDARAGDDRLIHWDPATDQTDAIPIAGGAVGVAAWPGGLFVAGQEHDTWRRDDGREKTVPHAELDDSLAVFAVSPHARLIAHAFRRSVQLLDMDSGERIGLPLASGSNAMDMVVQLAFDADGTRLMGRTLQGHWLFWNVAPEPADGSAMTRALVRLQQTPESQQAVMVSDPTERARLRRDDPGPWPPPSSRPVIASANNATAAVAIPERTQPEPATLLDLAPYYNIGPDEIRNAYYNVRPQMRPIPIGVQRLAGVDFDVRGMMQTDTLRQLGDPGGRAAAIHCAATPPNLRGIHALLGVSLPSPLLTGTPIALLTWHYRDGGQAVLPLRAGRELPGFAGNDAAVPWAFGGDMALTLQGLDDAGTALVAPWLPNPAPDRPVACFDLDRLDTERPLLVFALTAEPAPGRP